MLPRGASGVALAVLITVAFMVAAGWYVQTHEPTVGPPSWYWPRVHRIERHEAQVVRAERRHERELTQSVLRIIDRYIHRGTQGG